MCFPILFILHVKMLVVLYYIVRQLVQIRGLCFLEIWMSLGGLVGILGMAWILGLWTPQGVQLHSDQIRAIALFDMILGSRGQPK